MSVLRRGGRAGSDTETKSAAVRRASSAPLPRSPASRPAYSASRLCRPPPAGRCSDRCCPCCPETCTCRGWTQTIQAENSACWAVMLTGGGRIRTRQFMPTPYRRECNRAHIVFAGRTRCHDTSSPGEQKGRASVCFLVYLTVCE